MDRPRRELLIARIASGCIRLKVKNRVYLLVAPDRQDRYVANELYAEVFEESEEKGLYSEDSLLEFMLDHNFWDDERQTLMDKLPKEIEEFKVSLFKATFRSNEQAVIRRALAQAKLKLAELTEQRQAYSHLSCSGAATYAKTRYLFGKALRTESGERVFGTEAAFWRSRSGLLDKALAKYAECRLSEVDIREVARTEPWRSTWTSRAIEGTLFGTSPLDYTDEQNSLVVWSSLYDGILQHPECPSESVLEDDDMVDGWLIMQRRARGQGEGSIADAITNPKIRDAEEIYIVADTPEDARKVMDLNTESAKATLKKRFKTLRDKGVVNEVDMPDTRSRIRQQLVQQTSRTK